MTVSSKDLFPGILSMDSYHRGYYPGIRLTGDTVGTAILTLGSDEPKAGIAAGITADFYAAAYDTQWGTVISYRGTTFNGLPETTAVLPDADILVG